MATIGTLGPRVDIVLRKGVTLSKRRVSVMMRDPTHSDPLTEAPLVPISLAGATVTGEIRKYLNGQTDPFVTSFDIDQTDAALQPHEYYFGLSAAKSGALVASLSAKDQAGQYEYDFKVTLADGTVSPHMHGQLRLYRNVTA